MTSQSHLDRFLYRHRLWGKRLLSVANALLPRTLSRRLRMAAERLAFRAVPQYQGDTLPPVFHFWSHRYVRPMMTPLGVDTPEALYAQGIEQFWRTAQRPASILSLGSGGCALELQLAQQLTAAGIPLHIECLDLNPQLMAQARQDATGAGLSACMGFTVGDCNQGLPAGPFDVIIVNQFFHHIEDIETVCARLGQIMAPDGLLMSCDVVGRNGHVLWPAVDAKVQAYWTQLAPGQRMDRYYGRATPRYLSVDHAAYSNEGVRAQDIVRCLGEHFDFEVFLTFGGAIIPFVERRIGFNFDPASPVDAAFIERVAQDDRVAIANGDYPASNMIAVLRHRGAVKHAHYDPVSPQRHAALTRQQQLATA